MTKEKSIALIEQLMESLPKLTGNTYQAWQTQAKSYIKDIFGADSEEYKYIGQDWLLYIGMLETSFASQFVQNQPKVRDFLDRCIDTINAKNIHNPPLFAGKPVPTYDNDKDLQEIIFSEKITDDQVIRFFVKKRGSVNVTNLSYLVSVYAIDKTGLNRALVNLNTTGLIRYVKHPMAVLTIKAWWRWFRDSKNIWWLIAVLGLIVAVLAWLRPKGLL